MNGEFVEIEDNFVPDYVSDPYRRKHIRIRFNVKEGQTVDQTKDAVEQYIANYIHENKVESPHIVERYIPEEQLPVIKKENIRDEEKLSLLDMINSCTEFKVLETYRLIVKNNPSLQNIYDIKRKQLVAKESKEIIDQTNALLPKK